MNYYVPTDNLEEMNKLLDTYNPPKLNHKDKHLDRSIMSKEIDLVIKNLPKGLPWWPSG